MPAPRAPFDQGLFLTHFNKGRQLYDQRQFAEAEQQLEEAYLLRPRDPQVLNLLGLVYFKQEKLEKAEEIYRKLAAESPEAPTLFYNLGLICFKLNRLEEAESAFLKALELGQGQREDQLLPGLRLRAAAAVPGRHLPVPPGGRVAHGAPRGGQAGRAARRGRRAPTLRAPRPSRRHRGVQEARAPSRRPRRTPLPRSSPARKCGP
jgi:tetratricopeptide (TPR) repeat protein